MKAVKFLEKKLVIRFFGIALCLAPFINILLYFYLEKLKPNYNSYHMTLTELLKTGSPLHYFLAFCSLAIGLVMLTTGSKKVWKLVLVFLGIHIYIQFQHLHTNIKQNWLWGVFFLINAAAFVFIAEQLVFKVEPVKKKKLPRTEIGFKDYGSWAELVELNSQGIKVRHVSTLREAPQDLNTRTLDFSFKKGIKLKARLSDIHGSEYYFKFIDITPEKSKNLSDWINQNAA